MTRLNDIRLVKCCGLAGSAFHIFTLRWLCSLKKYLWISTWLWDNLGA